MPLDQAVALEARGEAPAGQAIVSTADRRLTPPVETMPALERSRPAGRSRVVRRGEHRAEHRGRQLRAPGHCRGNQWSKFTTCIIRTAARFWPSGVFTN